MRSKAYWILAILIIIGLLALGRSGLALDLDYESECVGKIVTYEDILFKSDLSNIFQNINIPEESKAVNLESIVIKGQITDAKLLCFDGQVILNDDPYSGLLDVNAIPSDIPLIVYNMNLVMAADGQVVLGDNVILDGVELSGVAISPLKITGSGVMVLNSPGIQAASVGILIEDTTNVEIHNSTISGPGMEEIDSVGINVVNSTGIEITDNPDTIENFGKGIEFDVNSDAMINNVSYDNVAQLIVGDGVTIDIENNVGKKLGEEDNIIRVAGFLPDVQCGDEVAENGQVEMYGQSELNEFLIVLESSCEIRKSTAGEVCLYIGSGAVPNDDEAKQACIESADCVCSEANSCIFDCTIDASPEGNIAFTYSDSTGVTAPFSSFKKTGILPNIIATYAPSVPVAAPEDELLDDGDDAGGNRASVETEDGSGVDSPLGGSLGMAKGCSLTKNAVMTIPPFIVLTMMILIPVAVRVRSRSRKRRK